MNHRITNKIVLKDTNLTKKISSNENEYLLNNKIALYCSSMNILEDKVFANNIETKSTQFREKYVKSLKLISVICEDHDIEFLLYKTHKFVPDINDGDIDIMIKPADFEKFLKLFSSLGFDSIEDEPGKGKCEKAGYCVIEPHTNMSWRGGGYLNQDFIWKDTLTLKIDGINVKNVSLEIEYIAILAKMLFEPSYLDLYSAKMLKKLTQLGVNEYKALDNSTRPDLMSAVNAFCKKTINGDGNMKYPVFLSNTLYLNLWTKNLLSDKNFKVYVLHMIYFFYWKYRYQVLNKLPFTHHHVW